MVLDLYDSDSYYLMQNNAYNPTQPMTQTVPGAKVQTAEQLFNMANNKKTPGISILNSNRMYVAPVQALKANQMTEAIIKLNETAYHVNAKCGKKKCLCGD